MLTPEALRNVYGGKEPAGPPPDVDAAPPRISLAECRRRSTAFSGQKIDVQSVNRTRDGNMRVEVTTDRGGRTFSVTVKKRRDGAWLIDEIRER